MKNWFLSGVLLATMVVLIQGCGVLKKDEGGTPAAVGCPPDNIMSPFYGRCIAQASCPRGYGQSLTQPSMCVNPMTGENVMVQQCGAGFTLTAQSGCQPQGPCGPGRALVSNACQDGVAGAGAGSYSGQPQMYGTGAMSPYGGMPYGGYQQPMYPYGYGAYPR